MSDTKNFEVITATPERLAVSPGRSYRTWSREAKERIVKETFLPGGRTCVGDRAVSKLAYELRGLLPSS